MDNIKRAILEGDTDKAIDLLIIHSQNQKAKSIIITSIVAEFNRVKEAYLGGRLTELEYSQAVNRINHRILSILDFKLFPYKNYTYLVVLVALILSVGYFYYYKFLQIDSMRENKIEVYEETINIITSLSSHDTESVDYKHSKVELDKMLNGKLNVLNDSLFYELLISLYYDLEQFERKSDITKSDIQVKSNQISKIAYSKIKKLSK